MWRFLSTFSATTISHGSSYSPAISIMLLTPSSLPRHSLLDQLLSCMFSHHCSTHRRDREVGWAIHMKYSVCLPLFLVQRVPQGTAGREKGSSSSVVNSASLPVNMFGLKLTFQILPVSVLEEKEIVGS